MKTKNKANFFSSMIGISLLLATNVAAHDIYIWPSDFTLNKVKPSSVTIDLTAGYTPYRHGRSMPSSDVKLTNIDGSEMKLKGGFYQGNSRSVFDLPITEQGTYAIAYKRQPSYYTTYKMKNVEKKKFKRINKVEAKKQLPKEAFEVKSFISTSTAMAFITNKSPSRNVFEPTNEGLELIPVTHPADYVTNEKITIKFLFDGKPIKGVEASIELEGAQYRKASEVSVKTSSAKGEIYFTLEQGGRYVIKVGHKQDLVGSKLADVRSDRIFYAFEVIYE